MRLSRRQWLLGATGLATAGLAAWHALPRRPFSAREEIPGELLGANHALGHRLRSGDFPAPTAQVKTGVLIIGGGISGLAAGRALHEAGVEFMLAELEDEVGGNAIGGANPISAYPWGAHYLPLPSDESREVRKLLEKLGVITGYNSEYLPEYDATMLCADPDERLMMYGRWQEGLLPQIGISTADRAEYRRFFEYTAHCKTLRGGDGRRAFCIPIDESSQDPRLLALDRLSFADWLGREGYASRPLRWLLDYSCRDDYGSGLDKVSAWAGLHYFAARNGRGANTASDTVLTWPEGNAWLARHISQPFEKAIRGSALAVRVEDGDPPFADLFLAQENRTMRVQAQAILLAVPRFVAARILRSRRFAVDAGAFQYSPWLVANISLDKLPVGHGAALAWDNVAYGSAMLGYVDATHQNLDSQRRQTVLTWYWPLDHLPPKAARKEALARDAGFWKSAIAAELLRLHPELEGAIRRIDLRLWGHGMIRPVPGFIWGPERRQALQQQPPLFFAHSDMAGISIFEEAYTYGVCAAGKILDYLGVHA